MVGHLVLLKARTGLGAEERQALISAFDKAVREIPTVRDVHSGRRITHGAGMKPRRQTPPTSGVHHSMISQACRRISITRHTRRSARSSLSRSVQRLCMTSTSPRASWEGENLRESEDLRI
jgi:hypothetical protein